MRILYHLQQFHSHFHSVGRTDQWSIEDVLTYLRYNVKGISKQSIDHLSQIFAEEEIYDTCQLQLLNDDLLEKMGITKTGVRLAVRKAIQACKIILCKIRFD